MSKINDILEVGGKITDASIPLTGFIISLLISLLCAFVLVIFYLYLNKQKMVEDKGIAKLFPFFALSMVTIFIVIQYSISLSVGLLGTLSIVRFRTPIKDPFDIAFIIVLISTSLLAATKNYQILAIFMLFALIVVVVVVPLLAKLSNKIKGFVFVFKISGGLADEQRLRLLEFQENKIIKIDSITEISDEALVSLQILKGKEGTVGKIRKIFGKLIQTAETFYN